LQVDIFPVDREPGAIIVEDCRAKFSEKLTSGVVQQKTSFADGSSADSYTFHGCHLEIGDVQFELF
jgi:hypothetical protein